MELLKKHADTVVILTAIISSMLWMNGKFNDIDMKFKDVEKEIAVMKAVMIMKNVMPNELAMKDKCEDYGFIPAQH